MVVEDKKLAKASVNAAEMFASMMPNGQRVESLDETGDGCVVFAIVGQQDVTTASILTACFSTLRECGQQAKRYVIEYAQKGFILIVEFDSQGPAEFYKQEVDRLSAVLRELMTEQGMDPSSIG